MSRERRQQAPPESGTSDAGGRNGLPAGELRLDDVAVTAFPGSSLADGYRSAGVPGDARAPQTAPQPAPQTASRPAPQTASRPAPQTASQTAADPAERPNRPSRGTGVRPRR